MLLPAQKPSGGEGEGAEAYFILSTFMGILVDKGADMAYFILSTFMGILVDMGADMAPLKDSVVSGTSCCCWRARVGAPAAP